jgi:predicted RNA-binding protein YlqC (UPF0109 family)
MDTFKKVEAPDPVIINLGGAWEADHWTRELGVSHGELTRIIGKVGNNASAVRKELGLSEPS